ncbi:MULTISPECIES: SAM-dependent methyltransferase [Rhizobium]|uniref:SAM-dependent methyltransferase n=1 Tax=Rhizobium phaseoli TaxID=396 RepID=UPI000F7429FE|nr:SAM-dependent methyltransferase [Rhizobium phaseoli]
MNVLSAATIDGALLRLNGELDRETYQGVNKVLEAAGGKWNRKVRAHVFDGDANEALEPILLTGEWQNTKQDFGQFDTPASLAKDIVGIAEILNGMAALEPSFGLGNIAIEMERAGAKVHGFEIDTKRYASGAQRCAFLGGKQQADFLKSPFFPDFDRVVMNPPFAGQADIRHVLHAHKFLKSGGLLVSIMSAGTLFRENEAARNFRIFVKEHGGTLQPLPENSFKDSGTAVRTCVATMPA